MRLFSPFSRLASFLLVLSAAGVCHAADTSLSGPFQPSGFGVPKPPYKVVLSGEIAKDTEAVQIEPFFFETQFSAKEDKGQEDPRLITLAQFKIIFRKAGVPIYESPLFASECTEVAHDMEAMCTKSDYSYGHFSHVAIDLQELPDEIVILHGDKPIYSLKEPAEPFPEIAITQQEYKDGHIRIAWEISGGKQLSYMAFAASYQSDPAHTLIGIGPILPSFGNTNWDDSKIFDQSSINLQTGTAIEGDTQLVLYASDGFRNRVAYSNMFAVDKSAVAVKILSPTDGQPYSSVEFVPLRASIRSFNPKTEEDYWYSDDQYEFTWTSDRDGALSHKNGEYCRWLTVGKHQLSLRVKNPAGAEATATASFEVVLPAPTYAQNETAQAKSQGFAPDCQ